MRSGGIRKLACVESSLRPLCSDQKTISFFVCCHCLRCNLGVLTRWHSLQSCWVPFARKRKRKKGCLTHTTLNTERVSRFLVACAHISRSRIGKMKICELKLLGPGFRVLTLELGHSFPAVVDSKDHRHAGWDGQTSMSANEISVKLPQHKWFPHAKKSDCKNMYLRAFVFDVILKRSSQP